MRLSVAFLLLFVCLSYQQGLQRWPYYWMPLPLHHAADHHDSFVSRVNPFNYHAYNDDEYYPSRRSYFFNQGRPPLLAIDEDESIPFFPNNVEENQQSYFVQSRTPFRPKLKNKSPESSAYDPFLSPNANEYNGDDQVEGRLFFGQNNANGGNGIASLLNPFSYGYVSNLPYIANPNRPSASISSGSSCTGSDGEPGTCQLPAVCNILGRQSSGSCGFLGARVCCLNVISKCGQTVTANNTFWQQPVNSSGISSCDLTVKLSDTVNEDRKKPICQVRLDFTRFSIEQPDGNTVCVKDVFSITGTQNNPANICGDNDDQHMYLDILSTAVSPTDLKLSFKLSTSSTLVRSWKIKIALLPCGASYLAPPNCLQYFTGSSGQFKSFNWKDSPKGSEDGFVIGGSNIDQAKPLPTRQLANQKQNICIRPQSSSISRICYSVCDAVLPFSLSLASLALNGDYADSVTAPSTAITGSFPNVNQIGIRNCNNDYLVIPGGVNKGDETNAKFEFENPNFGDRFCGERLSSSNPPNVAKLGTATAMFTPPNSKGDNKEICTELRPFNLYYRTNGDEDTTLTKDTNTAASKTGEGRGNQGFCLKFTQQ